MDKSILNLDVPNERLNEMYSGEGKDGDYYWYLKSNPFENVFLRPMGTIINELNVDSVLDVGCGEGWLSPFILYSIKYVGIEGSVPAVNKAKERYPESTNRVFLNCRIENPNIPHNFDVVVFGGILDVLIKRDRQMEFVQWYLNKVQATYLVIYDLDRFDETEFDFAYHWINKHRRTADMAKLQNVKRPRKVLVYRVK